MPNVYFDKTDVLELFGDLNVLGLLGTIVGEFSTDLSGYEKSLLGSMIGDYTEKVRDTLGAMGKSFWDELTEFGSVNPVRQAEMLQDEIESGIYSQEYVEGKTGKLLDKIDGIFNNDVPKLKEFREYFKEKTG